MIETIPALGLRDTDLPELWHKSDQHALRTQRQTLLLLRVELIFVVLATLTYFLSRPLVPALASMLGLSLGGVQLFGTTVDAQTVTNAVAGSIVPGVLIAISIVAAGLRFLLKPDAKWRNQRALAEACAGLAWRYSMHALPSDLPAATADGARDDAAFYADLDRLVAEAESLALTPPSDHSVQITARMRELRDQRDLEAQRAAYLTDRIGRQQRYYADRATVYYKRRNRLRWAMVGAYVVGGLLLPFNGLGVMTTAAGALGTWLAARHYEDFYQSYSSMARKLEERIDAARQLALSGGDAQQAWGQFVDHCETLLEGEHTQWLTVIARTGV
jgi:hypothetical protein